MKVAVLERGVLPGIWELFHVMQDETVISKLIADIETVYGKLTMSIRKNVTYYSNTKVALRIREIEVQQ